MKALLFRFLSLYCGVIIGLALGHRFFHAPLVTAPRTENSLQNTRSQPMPRQARTFTTQLGAHPPVQVEDEEFLKAMTEKDWQLTADLERRAKAGEYILQYESPATRRQLELLIGKVVKDAASTNAPAYRELFDALHVAPEVSTQLVAHIEKIHTASLEAETALQQLYLARQDYTNRLRSLLSPEDLAGYQRYEQAKPATRELQKLQSYAASNGQPLIPADLEAGISSLIQNAGAYTEKSWHDPLDAIPEPAMGEQMVVAQLERDIATMEKTSQNALQLAVEKQVPAEYQEVLRSYYQDQLARKRQTLERVRNPDLAHAYLPGH